MRTWLLLVGGFLVWTVHFFGLYAIASIWLEAPTGRVVAIAFTAACLAADVWLLRRTAPALGRAPMDAVDRWVLRLGFGGAALSALSVAWQGLPAFFV